MSPRTHGWLSWNAKLALRERARREMQEPHAFRESNEEAARLARPDDACYQCGGPRRVHWIESELREAYA